MISCLVRNATVNFPHMQILTEDVNVAVNFNCSDLNITTPARDFDSHKKHNRDLTIRQRRRRRQREKSGSSGVTSCWRSRQN